MSASMLWLSCPSCRLAKSIGLSPDIQEAGCSGCGRKIQGQVFPRAYAKVAPPPVPAAAPVPGDSICFYDPQQKATQVCSQCGVFMSEDWTASWGSRKVCLRCLEKLRESGKHRDFESGRVMWDNICLLLVLAPINPVLYFVVVITAPAALILGIRAWNRPRSITGRSRLRLVIAMILAALQVLFVIAGIYMLFDSFSQLSAS